MPVAAVNGVELYHEVLGSGDRTPILLVSGLGAHCTGYDDGFCELLVALGHPVVRFDNRDVGLSTHLPSGGYVLSDMAADAVALLDHLGVDEVHVVGCSMGGMISQLLAIDHGHRLRTLTSIMSTTGESHVGQPRPELLAALLELSTPADSAVDAIEKGVALARAIGSPDFDEAYHRRRQASFQARAYDPPGVGRQLLAIVASGPRDEGLRAVTAPTLVIHGTEDPLVDPSGGRRTAELVEGARYVEIPGMGHDLPPAHWDVIVGEIAAHLAAAETAAPAGRS